MYHDESTITMQSQENTVNNTLWITREDYALENTDGSVCYLGACNNKGPMTALTALENATSSWTNVKDQNYAMGTTIFKTNSYTGCRADSEHVLTCSTNTYTLPGRTAKARMITAQESTSFGCVSSEKSCPIWMYNYLYQSTSHGGTGTGNYNQGYWTMNSASDINSIIVFFTGSIGSNLSAQSQYGTRAVVVVDKYTKDNSSAKFEIEDNNQVVQVEDTAFSITKIGITIGLVIIVFGIMVIIQTLLKDKKKNQ